MALAVAGLLAGCGGSSKPSTTTDIFSNPISHVNTQVSTGSDSTPTATTPTTPTVPLTTVGTITLTGSGTKVREAVSLSSIGYGQSAAPPAEVEAGDTTYQGDADPSVEETSAFVQGKLVFTYVGGRVPINLSLDGSSLFSAVSGAPQQAAIVIFELDGQWTTGDEDAQVSFSMQPNQTVDVPIWIQITQAVTNVQAAIPQRQLNSVTWELTPTVDAIGLHPTTSYSGPQVANCGDGDVLLPFAHLPFTDPDSGTSCQANR